MQIKVYTIDFQLPRWLKRGSMFVGIPLLGLLGIVAVVRAAIPGFPLPIDDAHNYTDGQLLTADSLNSRFNDLKAAANTLATSIESVQTSNSTTQSQVSTIASSLTTGSGVKASSLVCPGCAAASANQPIGSVAFTLRDSTTTATAKKLGLGAHSGAFNSLDCGAGETPISGACIASGETGTMAVDVAITASYPEGSHWVCAFQNNAGGTVNIESRVVCLKAALVYPQ